MSNQIGDRNLLLGILALQKNFISKDALVAALNAWALDKSKGLSQILREQKSLSENHHALLEEGVDHHVAKHGNDLAKSLAAVSAVGPVRDALATIADPDLQASLAKVPSRETREGRRVASKPAPAEEPIEVVTVKEKRPSKPKKKIKQPSGMPAWVFLVGGLVVAGVFGLACVGAIVSSFFLLRDNPVAQGKPNDEEIKPGKNVTPKPPEKEPDPKPEPKKIDPPIKVEPPPAVSRKPTEVVGDGEWRIEGNELVVNNRLLKRAYLHFGSKEWTDYDFTFETKSEGRTAGSIALFRAASSANHYAMSLGAFLGKKHTLYRVENGQLTYDLPHFEDPYKQDQWYQVRIEVRGDRYRCFVDDEQVFDYTNNAHARGQVALGAMPQGIARWKNIKVASPTGKVLWDGPPDVSGIVTPPIVVQEGPDGFVPLFNGKDLTGWKPHKVFAGDWRVEDGILIGSPSKSTLHFLQTEQPQPKDFHLRLEARAGAPGNASVYFRAQPDGAMVGYDAMIRSTNNLKMPGWINVGGLASSTPGQGGTVAGARPKVLRAGEWFVMEVIAEGAHLVVKVDGQTTIDVTNSTKLTAGHLILGQVAQTVIEYRKIDIKALAPPPIVVKDLPPDPAPPFVAAEGFVPLFNGKDLAGWNQPKPFVGGWRIDNGMLVGSAAPNRSVRMSTSAKFKDFHLRAEVRSGDKSHASIGFRSEDGFFRGYNSSIISMWPPNAVQAGVRVGIINASTGQKGYTLPRLGPETVIPLGQWCNLEVIAEGERFIVLVNGKKTTDAVDANITNAGVIVLNMSGAETVEFRKLEIKELNANVVPPIIVKEGPDGFVPLFNGKDLTGWKTNPLAAGNWRVVNGLLTGNTNGNNQAYLFSNRDDYKDFHLRARVRCTGDSGSLVARAGFDFWGYDAKLNFQGLTGMLYISSKKLARTGGGKPEALPPGEWVDLDFIADGNRLIIKVNGKVKTDFIDKVNEFQAGHIALRHHRNSVIEFQKIDIKELNAEIVPPIIAKEGPDGFVPLFNGKDMTGWRPSQQMPGNWRVENGMLIANAAGKNHGYLYSERAQPKDFHLRVEAKAGERGSGNVYFRCPEPDKLVGYDVTINSTTPSLPKTGSMNAHVPGKGTILATLFKTPILPEEWFILEIIAQGERLIVKVDGQTTANVVDPKHIGAGHLALMSGNSIVAIRKVEIKNLNADAVPPIVAKEPPPGFTPLFNGKDLAGWKRHKLYGDDWRVENGILIGSAGPRNRARLDTERIQPKDFHLRVEARLNANAIGNVSFRSPEDALFGYEASMGSWVGGLMFQNPGGVGAGGAPTRTFPRIPDSPLFQPEPGKWFLLEVIAQGSRYIVKVDGKERTDFVDASLLTAGTIGLTAHTKGAIEFRRIDIKDLAGAAVPPIVVKGPVFELKTTTGFISASSTLVQSDLKYRGKISKAFLFPMEAGKNYQIDLKSKLFDCYLYLEDPDGKLVAEDDDGGGGLDARIVHKASKTGKYRIVASSLQGQSTGAFQLVVRDLDWVIAKLPPKLPPKLMPGDGFVPLFNGKDLTGWQPHAKFPGNWKVVNNVLAGFAPNPGFLATTRTDYKDFHLRMETRFSANRISGSGSVLYRTSAELLGYESLINDPNQMTGRTYIKGKEALRDSGGAGVPLPASEWCTLEIIAEGSRVQVKVNGKATTDFIDKDKEFTSGQIVLRHVADALLEFRKIEIMELRPGGVTLPPPVVAGGEFVPLFNGKDTTGWQTHPKRPGNWKVEDGVLIGSAPAGGLLYSTRSDYHDFHLRVQARINDKGFGRVFFRAAYEPAKVPFKIVGYEALINQRPIGDKTGTLNVNSFTSSMLKAANDAKTKPGEWFTLEAIAVRDHVTIKVNGVTVADLIDSQQQFALGGHIVLRQDTDGVIEFRKVEIKELVAAKVGVRILVPMPIPMPMPKELPDGFVSLFDGKDLVAWKTFKGQAANWRIEDGILIGSGIAAGRVSSPRADYQNFHLRVEARISDKGTGGILFRAPFGTLKGYEVPINSSNAFNDKTGSLYVHGAEKSGPLVSVEEAPVPFGEWFTLEVIAEGNRVTVKVNGKTTADAVDVGSAFTSGHIALRHELRSTIEFRKIEIKELPATP